MIPLSEYSTTNQYVGKSCRYKTTPNLIFSLYLYIYLHVTNHHPLSPGLFPISPLSHWLITVNRKWKWRWHSLLSSLYSLLTSLHVYVHSSLPCCPDTLRFYLILCIPRSSLYAESLPCAHFLWVECSFCRYSHGSPICLHHFFRCPQSSTSPDYIVKSFNSPKLTEFLFLTHFLSWNHLT